MECKGKLINADKDWVSGKFRLTFEIEDDVSGQIDGIADKPLRIKAVHWREKRSLDSNAYYWALLSKFAEALDISKPRAHNIMLREYGQVDLSSGHLSYAVIPDTEEAENDILERQTFHIRPTSDVRGGKDGINYRTYIILRGSSQYDTAEMSHLLNGLINDCKPLGIETATPEELERMKQLYDQNRREDG
jgi:hypothetical protein